MTVNILGEGQKNKEPRNLLWTKDSSELTKKFF